MLASPGRFLILRGNMSRLRVAAYWFAFWLAVSLAIVAVGAVLGALIWVVVGTLAGAERNSAQLLRDGASVGWRYARVWAGGIAFILCFVKAHEKFSVRAWWRSRAKHR
jgi:hypothetical protein